MRSYITAAQVEQARRAYPVRWTPIAQDTYRRTYSRIKPDGSQEDWYETCARVVNGNCSFVDDRFIEPDEPEKLYRMMLQMKLLPGGRHLWVTGALTSKVYLANCHCADFTEQFSEHFEYVFSRLMEGGGVGANYSVRYVNSRAGNKPWVVWRRVHVHILLRPQHPDQDRILLLEPNDSAAPAGVDDQGRPFTTLRHLVSRKYSADWSGNGSRLTAQNRSELIEQLHRQLAMEDCQLVYLQVEDSREGWALALSALLECFVAPHGPDELDFIFDLNLIREFGAPLRTFGGTASGPGALALLLTRIAGLLNSRQGHPVSSLDAMLIDHYIACCVVAGGARRSARMAMKYWQDPDIMEFIRIKRPVPYGERELFYPHHTTNISVVVDHKFLRAVKRGHPAALQVLDAVIDGMLTGRGEPGLINASKCAEGEAPGTEFYSTNPCVTEDTLVLTEHGILPVSHLTDQPFSILYGGQPYRCEGFFATGRKPVYEVVTEEGTSLQATADHRLLVYGSEPSPYEEEAQLDWKSVQELRPGDLVAVQGTLVPSVRESVSELMDLLDRHGSESSDGDAYFVWIADRDAGRYWKRVLNLLGIRSRLVYREAVDAWSLRIDKADLKWLRRVFRQAPAGWSLSQATTQWAERVREVRYVGELPVYDCTVEQVHCYLSNGLVSHNCGEIAFVRYPDMRAFDVCNLGHVNLAQIQDAQEMEEAFRLMTRFLIRATFAPQSDEKMTRSIERNRRIGVGFLGYHTWLVLHGIRYSEAPESEFVRNSLKRWYSVVREEARRYCSQLRIPECIKVTAIAPTGTVGTMASVSTGIQPVFAPFYLRRVEYNANDDLIATRFALELLDRVGSSYSHEERELVRHALQELAQSAPETPNLSWVLESLQSLLPASLGARFAQDAVETLRDSVKAVAVLLRLVAARSDLGLTAEDERLLRLPIQPHPAKASHYIASYLVVDSTTKMLVSRLLERGEAGSESEAMQMAAELVESQYELEPRHFLANLRMAQELFADNCISITINVDPERITPEQLRAQILEYLPHLKGVTVMPVYRAEDAPLQAVSAEEMQVLVAQGVPLSEESQQEECATGACPVR